MDKAAIVLAAGAGTRMQSNKPKVLHLIMDKPLVTWVIEAAKEAEIDRIVSVVGFGRDEVIPVVEDDCAVVVQDQQLGTADAVARCREFFLGFSGSIVVLSGDCPLITASTIKKLVDTQQQTNAAVVVLTMQLDDPFGYGRIIYDDAGNILEIVEQKDANEYQAAIKECNSGFYCFDAEALFEALSKVGNSNAQGEFYLTDVVKICVEQGKAVRTLKTENPYECLGINTQEQLDVAACLLQQRYSKN